MKVHDDDDGGMRRRKRCRVVVMVIAIGVVFPMKHRNKRVLLLGIARSEHESVGERPCAEFWKRENVRLFQGEFVAIVDRRESGGFRVFDGGESRPHDVRDTSGGVDLTPRGRRSLPRFVVFLRVQEHDVLLDTEDVERDDLVVFNQSVQFQGVHNIVRSYSKRVTGVGGEGSRGAAFVFCDSTTTATVATVVVFTRSSSSSSRSNGGSTTSFSSLFDLSSIPFAFCGSSKILSIHRRRVVGETPSATSPEDDLRGRFR